MSKLNLMHWMFRFKFSGMPTSTLLRKISSQLLLYLHNVLTHFEIALDILQNSFCPSMLKFIHEGRDIHH